MFYYPLHIGDFRSATVHLSVAEELAYRRALDWYYETEAALPLDAQWVSRRLRVNPNDLQTVLDDFFVKTDDGWVNARCEAEIAAYRKLVERNQKNGKKGGRPKTTSSPSGNPLGFDGDSTGHPAQADSKANQEPGTNTQGTTPLPPALPAVGDGEVNPKRLKPEHGSAGHRFDDFWKAWPKNERKQDKAKCFAKWKRNSLDLLADTILADIAVKCKTKKWIDGFVEAPLVYLNGSRWEDGVQPQEPGQEAQSVQSWWDTKGGVEKRAKELFMKPWSCIDDATGRQIPFAEYRATVIDAARQQGEAIA